MLDIKMTLTKMLTEYKNSLGAQETKTVLFYNPSGTCATFSLSESAANFDYLEIYYKDNDDIYGYTKVTSPNGKTILLWCGHASIAKNGEYRKSSCIVINGTEVSFNRQIEAYFTTAHGISQVDHIFVIKVVGVKEGIIISPSNTNTGTRVVGTDIIDLASGLSFNRYDCRIKDGFLILNCFIYKNGSNFTTPRETIGTLREGYKPALYISTICTGSNGQDLHANRSAGVIINTAGGVSVDPHSTDMKQIYLYVMLPLQNTGRGD